MNPTTAAAGLALWLACGLAPTPARAAPADNPSGPPPTRPDPTTVTRLWPLEVRVNGVAAGTWVLLDKDGQLHATDDAFQEWRVERAPQQAGALFRHQTWYPLASVAGFTFRLNRAEQSIDLVFSANVFPTTRMGAEGQARALVSVAEPAVFLNVDTTATRLSARDQPTEVDVGALTELGIATGWGVLTTSHVVRYAPAAGRSGRRLAATRLETGFVRDFPARNTTLRIGDTVTRGGMWGRSAYFGGVQLSRNFALTPGFVTQPIPSLSGVSTTPSTVSLYVDDVLRQTSQVPPGPFAIDNFPLLTGSGRARLVVRDLLGRETVVEESFFSHASLLEPGLSDWSVEAGRLRRNLGTDGTEYGEPFTAGLWRQGIHGNLTLDGQAVLARSVRGLGLGATFSLPGQMLGQAGVRLSDHQTRGRGHEWLIGLDGQHRNHGFALRGVGASRAFRALGADHQDTPNQMELVATYSHQSERMGFTNLAWTRLRSRQNGVITTLSANHSWRVGRDGYLSFTTSRVMSGGGDLTLGVTYGMPLGDRASTHTGATWRGGRRDLHSSVTQARAGDTGLGWRLQAGQRADEGYGEAGIHHQGDRWLLSGDVSQSRGQQALRLGAQGALVFMDGRLFTSRHLQGSFALVEVAGYADVGVGLQGSVLTRTDARGQALLPRLMPFQKNHIRLDPTELPISAELDDIEQIAVPPWRSGVKVTFPVRSGRAALVRVVLEDGQPAPAGARLTLSADTQVFHVARRGEVFVTGLGTRATARLQWNGAHCTLDIALPPGAIDDIARVGPLVCKGVPR